MWDKIFTLLKSLKIMKTASLMKICSLISMKVELLHSVGVEEINIQPKTKTFSGNNRFF